jgi:hypothetical protein
VHKIKDVRRGSGTRGINLLVLSSHSASYVSVNGADLIRTSFAIAASGRAGSAVYCDSVWRSSGLREADAATDGPTVGSYQPIVHKRLWNFIVAKVLMVCVRLPVLKTITAIRRID